MRAFFQRTFDTNMKRLAAGSFGGFLASAALLAALFFGEALASEEAYAELARAVALLSALGFSVACAGYLTLFVFRLHAGDPGLWGAVPALSRKPFSDAGSSGGEDWPLLITLLFRKIPVLFAGLAGWVEARA